MAPRLCSALLLAGLMAFWSPAEAAKRAKNHFGSISIDGKKAGHIHYTVEYGEDDEIETLRTRASHSILGIKVFNFEQNLHEEWQRSKLQRLRCRTDDDGTIYDASLQRGQAVYSGALNNKPIELPHTAYPASVWHYTITEQSLLFDLKSLKLMNVKIARKDETLTIHKKKIRTERFDFSGEWQATVWFNTNKQLIQFKYVVDGHEVKVNLDE